MCGAHPGYGQDDRTDDDRQRGQRDRGNETNLKEILQHGSLLTWTGISGADFFGTAAGKPSRAAFRICQIARFLRFGAIRTADGRSDFKKRSDRWA
jgi:hypothetical protein